MMSRAENKFWFDKAFAHILEGDFAAATAAFEYIVTNSDPLAAQIAEQRLRWYCIPLQGVFDRIQQSQLPVNIHEVLADIFHVASLSLENGSKLTILEAEKRLSEIPSCIRIGEKYWIRKDAFDAILQFIIDNIQKSSTLVLLADLIKEKCVDTALTDLEFPDYSTLSIFADKLPKQDIHIFAEFNCCISNAGISKAIEALADVLHETNKPINLKGFLSKYYSTNPFLGKLESFFKGQLDARFVEVTSGFLFLVELLKLEIYSFDYCFQEYLQPISISELLTKYLFPERDTPPKFSSKFLHSAENKLSSNPYLYSLGSNQWMLTSQVQQFLLRVLEFLRRQDQAIVLSDVLQNSIPTDQENLDISDSLIKMLRMEFSQSQEVIDMGNDRWIHEETLRHSLDKIYNFLLVSKKPISTSEIIQQALNINKEQYSKRFIERLRQILLTDERIFGEIIHDVIYWQLNNPSRKYFDRSYQIIFRHHEPLTLAQIRAELTEDDAEVPEIDLTTDVRFIPFPGTKWGLSQWIWLNDLAFDYIMKTRQQYHARVVVGIICQQKKIPEQNAIFTPEEDKRFVKDSINRWGIIYRLSNEDINKIYGDLFNKMGVGSKLENALKRVVQLPVYMTDAEEVLSKDERFICLDSRWFARQTAFYQVTQPDLNLIYEKITSLPLEQLPISVDYLIRESLGRDVRLTDAVEKLKLDDRFFEYHDGFWAFASFVMPEIVRGVGVFGAVHIEGKNVSPDNDGKVQLPTELTVRKGTVGEKPRKAFLEKKAYITLSHLDILHGNLRVSGFLKRLISETQTNVLFIDDEDYEFISPLDETRSILHIRPWLEKRSLTFGNKISIEQDKREGRLFIKPYGKRDERVYQESIQHQDLEKLIAEAQLVNKSYHDLIIEVMETLSTSLHREDIFQLVDYQRTASRNTIFEILSLTDCPYEELRYFVPHGKGYWSFNRARKEAYDMKMQELVQLNAELNQRIALFNENTVIKKSTVEQNQLMQFAEQIALLETEKERFSVINQELNEQTKKLSSQNNEYAQTGKALDSENKLLHESLKRSEENINGLRTQLEELQVQQSHRQDENTKILEQLNAQKNDLLQEREKNKGFEGENIKRAYVLEELISQGNEQTELVKTLEVEKEILQEARKQYEENINTLQTQLEELQAQLSQKQNESTNILVELDVRKNDLLQERGRNLKVEEENVKQIQVLQVQLIKQETELKPVQQEISQCAHTTDQRIDVLETQIKFYAAELDKAQQKLSLSSEEYSAKITDYKQRLDKLRQALTTPLGRLVSRILGIPPTVYQKENQ